MSGPFRSRRRRRSSLRIGPGATIHETAFGTFAAYYRASHGIQQRRSFGTLDAARDWIARMQEGAETPPLTGAQYEDAQAALRLLPPGTSLLAFVREALRGKAAAAAPLDDAIRRFLGERRRIVSETMLKGYERELRRFEDAVGGGTPLGAVSRQTVVDYVAPMDAGRRNKVLRHLSPMFAWAVRSELIPRNPCALVERARDVAASVGVFSPADAERLLRGATKMVPRLVPYLAIGLFAGVRPAELARLTPDCIGAEYIRLDARITKTSRARTVAIRPNLRAWLDAYPPEFPLLPKSHGAHMVGALHKALGIAWPPDGMRHSFATYAYEMSHDAAAVAAEMGHTGTAVFFKHYRALAEPGDGARFFGIVP